VKKRAVWRTIFCKKAARRPIVTKSTLRVVLTILMYTGVVIFLVPYFIGVLTAGVAFMIGGAALAVVCGLLRCYLTEGDCGRIPHSGRDW
jgi:membrane protein CcdC involved in cytochrome C biogenesis